MTFDDTPVYVPSLPNDECLDVGCISVPASPPGDPKTATDEPTPDSSNDEALGNFDNAVTTLKRKRNENEDERDNGDNDSVERTPKRTDTTHKRDDDDDDDDDGGGANALTLPEAICGQSSTKVATSIEKRREKAARFNADAMPELDAMPILVPFASIKRNDNDNDNDSDNDDDKGKSKSKGKSRVKGKSIIYWKTKYEELVEFKNRMGHCRVPCRFDENPQLGQWVASQRNWYKKVKNEEQTDAIREKIRLLEDIGFVWTVGSGRLLENGWAQWREHFDSLVEYKAQKGNCRVPSVYPENPPFGRWVAQQRQQYNKMKEGKPAQINEERIQLLDSIGFEWVSMVGPVNNDMWMERFEQLKDFYRDTGHFKVKMSDDPVLGRWVYRQKNQYKKMKEGRHTNLTKERIQELEKIGFEWDFDPDTAIITTFNGDGTKPSSTVQGVSMSLGAKWNKRYQELIEFKAREGHTKVPWRYFDNLSLSEWTSKQRQHWKWLQQGKKSPLTSERIMALRAIDFTFEIDQKVERGQSWFERFEELKQFYHREGHCRVPKDHPNKRLAMWVWTQRKQYNARLKGVKSFMTDERVTYLNELNFDWSISRKRSGEEIWNSRYAQLKQFYLEEGHFKVTHKANQALATWLSEQRKNYKRLQDGLPQESITPERLTALNALSVNWASTSSKLDHSNSIVDDNSASLLPEGPIPGVPIDTLRTTMI